jgi:hypothetical protein
MKINTVSYSTIQPSTVSKPVTEYIELVHQENVEVKVALQKIEKEMVELKVLIDQIAAIRCNKDVS